MKRISLVLIVLSNAITSGVAWWKWHRPSATVGVPLVLYGNVEIRQVDLAFAVDGPIPQVLIDGIDGRLDVKM